MERFTWKVNADDFSETAKFTVREVKFGYGYMQVQPSNLLNN